MVPSSEQLISMYVDSLLAGQNVVFVSTSKAFLKELEKITKQMLKLEEYAFYTSDTSREKLRKDGLNAHVVWKVLRALHYTATISAGISFSLEHFDKIFIYGGPGSCEALTLFQMIFRVRQLRTGDMLMYINPQKNRLPTTFQTVERFLEESHNEIYYEMGENYIGRKISPEGKYYYPSKNWQYRLYINNLISQFRSENNYSREILRLLSQMMIPVTYIEADLGNDLKKKLSHARGEAKQLIKSEQLNLILQSAELTSDQYNNLKQKCQYQQLTQEENASMLKYYVRQIYQLDESQILNAKFIEKYYIS